MIVPSYRIHCDGSLLDGFDQEACALVVEVAGGRFDASAAERDAELAGWTKHNPHPKNPNCARHYCPACDRLRLSATSSSNAEGPDRG